jgi:ATP-dependent helicase STH1/SNF2
MQLKKICNHPFVFEEVENALNPYSISNDLLWRVSGKFELLDRILPKFKRSGHRVSKSSDITLIHPGVNVLPNDADYEYHGGFLVVSWL